MSYLTGKQRDQYIRTMFTRIARRYNLLNRLMTFGQDVCWRREAIRYLEIKPQSVVIDMGSGTGDIALEIARKHPGVLVVAIDFTPEMIHVGKNRPGGETVHWLISDVQHLPFAHESVSSVISGFLLRNVPVIDRLLTEHHRVLVNGGRAVSLDTTPPRDNMLRPVLEFYLRRIIPILGKLVAGEGEVYAYLSHSTKGFFSAETLAEHFRQTGFSGVKFVRRMLGIIGIHWGEKKHR
jgi:demethylmenaquinone methyltransferase/2-methoxy-6-polyprenyl-1,4-benzoquinol methylase